MTCAQGHYRKEQWRPRLDKDMQYCSLHAFLNHYKRVSDDTSATTVRRKLTVSMILRGEA